MKVQEIQNSQNNLEKEEVGNIMLPDFKLHYKTKVIKIVWYQNKNRQIYQWNRQSPDMNPHLHGQTTQDKQTHLHRTNMVLQQRRQEYKMKKRQPLHYMVLEKPNNYMKKNETRLLSHNIHKKELKMH